MLHAFAGTIIDSSHPSPFHLILQYLSPYSIRMSISQTLAETDPRLLAVAGGVVRHVLSWMEVTDR